VRHTDKDSVQSHNITVILIMANIYKKHSTLTITVMQSYGLILLTN